MIANIKAPNSGIVHQAEELARSVSTDTLFNHVMRCYWLGELYAQRDGILIDSEQLFLSAVFHDLGLTDHARGPHRFEIEGAHAARRFLVEGGVSKDRAGRLGRHRVTLLGHQSFPGRHEPRRAVRNHL